jgi:hypothetical protein
MSPHSIRIFVRQVTSKSADLAAFTSLMKFPGPPGAGFRTVAGLEYHLARVLGQLKYPQHPRSDADLSKSFVWASFAICV